MLGILLITWKNGRIVKTYGLKRRETYNMKFTFICIVIVVLCSVCASGDLEIYPDLKFDLSSEEQRPRLENDDDVSFYSGNYRRWPWEKSQIENWLASKKEQDFGIELPEQLEKFQELLDRSRSELSGDDVYYNPKNFDNVYDEYKSKLFEGLNYKYPSSQLLDDVRPYPHEDDFTFGDNEMGEEVPDHVPQHDEHVHQAESSHSTHMEHMGDDKAQTDQNDIGLKEAFANAKFVEDLSQFAYLPSDPRFFMNTESTITDGPKIKTKLEKIPDNKIHVSLRSDEGIQENPIRAQHVKSRNNNNEPSDEVVVKPQTATNESAGIYIIAVVAGISAAATVGLIAVGIGWYNLQKHVKNASDVEYPAYGVTGPNKDASPSGDRRLAQSAQMYHYQHQKQQIIAMESRTAAGDRHGSVSEADSDEENEEGDYTVYECPGLAPTGEMEVKNPLFQDDPTPAQTPPVKPNGDEKK